MPSLREFSYLAEFSMDNSKNQIRISIGASFVPMLFGGMLIHYLKCTSYVTNFDFEFCRERETYSA